MLRCLLFIVAIFVSPPAFCQSVQPTLLHQPWSAQWITCPGTGLKAYEVFHFRRTFRLNTKPARFILHISADSRYKLFVNGRNVGLGPARSDLAHWNYETYDIAPFLHEGQNTLAALVWDQGQWNGYAQHSCRTALIIQGDDPETTVINTGVDWKVIKDTAYSPVIFQHSDPRLFWQYYVAGALDSVRGKDYPWSWEDTVYDDSRWLSPAPPASSYQRGSPPNPLPCESRHIPMYPFYWTISWRSPLILPWSSAEAATPI